MEDSLKIAEKVLSFGKKGERLEELKTVFKNLDIAQKSAEYRCENFIKNISELAR